MEKANYGKQASCETKSPLNIISVSQLWDFDEDYRNFIAEERSRSETTGGQDFLKRADTKGDRPREDDAERDTRQEVLEKLAKHFGLM